MTEIQENINFNVIDKILDGIHIYEIDFIVGFIGFYIIRYLAPNTILGVKQDMTTGLTLAFFFATFNFIRSAIIDYKKQLA